MGLQRVAQNTAELITHDFGDEGLTTVTAPVLRVERDDGTEIVPTTVVYPVDDDPLVYGYELGPEHTAQLDQLTAYWSATVGGVPQTFTDTIEVAGDVLFSVTQLGRMNLGGQNTIATRFTSRELLATRNLVEDTLEDACGVAFVPRYERVELTGGSDILILPPYTRAVRWVETSLGSDAAAPSSSLTYAGGRFLRSPYLAWPEGVVTVGVEHGMLRPPERVRRAALLLAKVWLVSGPVDDRVTVMSSPDTGITASLAVPGRAGSWVGVPEVDAVINAYRIPAFA